MLALCVINKPQGVYYGGTIAAPVVKEIFENILPYLGLEKARRQKPKSGLFWQIPDIFCCTSLPKRYRIKEIQNKKRDKEV